MPDMWDQNVQNRKELETITDYELQFYTRLDIRMQGVSSLFVAHHIQWTRGILLRDSYNRKNEPAAKLDYSLASSLYGWLEKSIAVPPEFSLWFVLGCACHLSASTEAAP